MARDVHDEEASALNGGQSQAVDGSDPVDQQLSAAVVAYFKVRSITSDEQRIAALASVVGTDELPNAKDKVDDLVKETFVLGTRYSDLELLAAMNAVADDLRAQHTELTEEATDSLAWYWSYCNR